MDSSHDHGKEFVGEDEYSNKGDEFKGIDPDQVYCFVDKEEFDGEEEKFEDVVEDSCSEKNCADF